MNKTGRKPDRQTADQGDIKNDGSTVLCESDVSEGDNDQELSAPDPSKFHEAIAEGGDGTGKLRRQDLQDRHDDHVVNIRELQQGFIEDDSEGNDECRARDLKRTNNRRPEGSTRQFCRCKDRYGNRW